MSVYIHQLETLVPEHSAEQRAIAGQLGEWSRNAATARIIRHIFKKSGIERRYSVLPDFKGNGEADLFRENESGVLLEPSTAERMRIYSQHAGPMSVKLAQRFFNAGSTFYPEDVTHVITVSCTGFENPGADWRIVTELGLNPGIQRYHLGFMGCYAALPALKMARQFCVADPEAVVLVVCLELCSLHMQMNTNSDSILANALFADGAAAALISAREPDGTHPSLRLDSFGSSLAPEGSGEMAWNIGNNGFNLVLSSYVPSIIGANIESIVESQIAPQGLALSDIDLWAVHPGGRAILDQVENSLTLRPDQLNDSRSVLRNFGNMSSATVLFVLKRMLENSTDFSKTIAAMAFGPGLTIECGLLELIPARKAIQDVYEEMILTTA